MLALHNSGNSRHCAATESVYAAAAAAYDGGVLRGYADDSRMRSSRQQVLCSTGSALTQDAAAGDDGVAAGACGWCLRCCKPLGIGGSGEQDAGLTAAQCRVWGCAAAGSMCTAAAATSGGARAAAACGGVGCESCSRWGVVGAGAGCGSAERQALWGLQLQKRLLAGAQLTLVVL